MTKAERVRWIAILEALMEPDVAKRVRLVAILLALGIALFFGHPVWWFPAS